MNDHRYVFDHISNSQIHFLKLKIWNDFVDFDNIKVVVDRFVSREDSLE